MVNVLFRCMYERVSVCVCMRARMCGCGYVYVREHACACACKRLLARVCVSRDQNYSHKVLRGLSLAGRHDADWETRS